MYTLEILQQIVSQCRKCALHQGRNKTVFGVGNPSADILLVGEGPGQQEDQQGDPFVGPAGQLLTKAIEGIGMNREKVYIANIVKCRPPGNRNPLKEEMESCIPYLRWQVKLIQPKIILCLGAIAATNIIDQNFKITKQRGQWIEKKGIWLIATFHPSAVLRDEMKKRPFWEDFKELKRKYDEILR
ncbi:uracil-DNA glycosylase [Geosporobacter ferrireducens]|uniref:Type-4 uracil-DNA glycosylase n=1 Tax=Geosporobacter ferrireducens TaxID=1424294 RepID=A0A1D8GHR5_9FIRM|nr:uracil-DNA glycosylase [Geosporobacter ferrireducens]AOT70444.1 uracil-DNA glycosylase [Geosporobacter ferrireducens]MTI57214.1 uracil-DNA glycosylase [Geosporobacter ferrireducens]